MDLSKVTWVEPGFKARLPLTVVIYCLSNEDSFFQLIGKKDFLLLANLKKFHYNNNNLYYYKK